MSIESIKGFMGQLLMGLAIAVILNLIMMTYKKITEYKKSQDKSSLTIEFVMQTIGVLVIASDFLFLNFLNKVVTFIMIISMLSYMWVIVFILNDRK